MCRQIEPALKVRACTESTAHTYLINQTLFQSIGKHKDGTVTDLVMINSLNLTIYTWATESLGQVADTAPALAPHHDRFVVAHRRRHYARVLWHKCSKTCYVLVQYGWAGFTRFGSAFPMANTWQAFTSYRFGVFNFATKALSGNITVKRFELNMP